MAFLPGKFARFSASGLTTSGAYQWSVGFRRERLDTTNFESAVSVSGNNVHSEGLTGVLDTTFTVQGYVNDAAANILFPEAQIACTLQFRKSVTLGYTCTADVLSFAPQTAVRDKAGWTAELQTNGLVAPAA